MASQIVKKSDLSSIVDRWTSSLKLGEADALEIMDEGNTLVIRKPQQSVVQETQGTIKLPEKTVHEIALSQEIIDDF